MDQPLAIALANVGPEVEAVHLGVLVMAVGVAVSSGLATDLTVTLAPGEWVVSPSVD